MGSCKNILVIRQIYNYAWYLPNCIDYSLGICVADHFYVLV